MQSEGSLSVMVTEIINAKKNLAVGAGRPKRYLMVLNEIGFLYSHFWALATAIQQAGWEVVIAGRNAAGSLRAEKAGMQFIELPLKIGIGGPLTELRAALALRAAIISSDPDVLHLVSLKNVVIGGLLAKRRKGVSVLGAITGLGTMFLEQQLLYSVLRPIVMTGLRKVFHNPRSVMALENHDDQDFFVDKYVVRRERSFVIPGAGLDINAITPERASSDWPVILCVSRMIRGKGIQHLLDAARILQDEGLRFELVLAGDIDEHNRTSFTREEMRSAESGGNVKWLGHRTDIPAILREATIVCLPTYREGLPRSLVEAIAAGRPIVATDVPGCREVVVDGLNGRLAEPRNALALADALRDLLCDSEACKRMGIESRKRFEELFTTESSLAAFNKCYEALGIPLQVGQRRS